MTPATQTQTKNRSLSKPTISPEANRTPYHWALLETTKDTHTHTFKLANFLTGKPLTIKYDVLTQHYMAVGKTNTYHLDHDDQGKSYCSCPDAVNRQHRCYHGAAFEALLQVLAGLRLAKPKYRKTKSGQLVPLNWPNRVKVAISDSREVTA